MFFSNPITEHDPGRRRRQRGRSRDDALSAGRMIRERAGASGVAVLTAPLNIGWGRKADGG